MTARFGQLTYTSVDSGQRSAGGWQVMEADGLTEDESKLVARRVDPGFRWPNGVPPIPTDAERAAMPRRLVYGPVEKGGVETAYWHTIPAGDDAGGRPGNVFAHVVIDREPDHPADPLRPMDLAMSVDWLRPFGRVEVRAAALRPLHAPVPDVAAERRSVVAFLRDILTRGGVLAVLQDALRDAMSGGPLVVLGVGDLGSAGGWIAAVGHLMSPGTSRRLYWSTLERADTLADAQQSGIHLAVVPRDDLGDPQLARFVVLDEFSSPTRGDLHAEPHRAANDQPVAVTAWSVITEAVLEDQTVATQVLADQDAIAAEVGDHGLEPAWPMAVAVTSLPNPMPDADIEANELAESGMPSGRDLATLQRVMARQLRRTLGKTAADAWNRLQELVVSAAAPPVLRELAARVYLERTLSDDDWLLRTGGVPVPAHHLPAHDEIAWVHDAINARLKSAGDQAGARPARFAAVSVRLVDFAVRAGLLDLDANPLRTDLLAHQLVEQALAPVALDGNRATEFVNAVGPVVPDVRAGIVVPVVGAAVAHSTFPAGQRVHPTMLRWLFPNPPPLPSWFELTAEGAPLDPLLAEAAAQATLIFGDPSVARPIAIWEAVSGRPPRADRLALLADGPTLPPWQLIAAAQCVGVGPLLRFLLPTLIAAPNDDNLTVLLGQHVLAKHTDLRTLAATDPLADRVLAIADLRYSAAQWWMRREGERQTRMAMNVLSLAERVLTENPGALLAPDLLGPLTAAHVVDVICRPIPPQPRPLLDQRIAQAGPKGGIPKTAVDILWNSLEAGVVSDDDLVWAALHAAPTPLPGPPGAPRLHTLSGLTTVTDRGVEPLLMAVARLRAQQQRFAAAEVRDRVEEIIRADIRDAVHDRHEARRLSDEHERFAKRWWAAVAGGTADVGPVRWS